MEHNYTDAEILCAWNYRKYLPSQRNRTLNNLRAFLAALPMKSAEPERPQAQLGPWPGQQEAIDAAIKSVARKMPSASLVADPDMYSVQWPKQEPLRLAIAQAYDAARPQAAEIAKLKDALAESEKQFQAKVDEIVSLLSERDRLTEELTHAVRWRDKLDTKLTEIVEAAERAGWDGVENSKSLPKFITDLAEGLSKAEAERDRLAERVAVLQDRNVDLEGQRDAAMERIGIEHTEMKVQKELAEKAKAELAKWRSGATAQLISNQRDSLESTVERAEKAEAAVAESQRKLAYAEEHLGILAKTFGYEGRTWCNMVSYLAPRLQKAERERDKLKAELASLRQPILADDGTDLFRVFNQHSNTIEGLQAVASVVEARVIRRMEAVPVGEIARPYETAAQFHASECGLEAVRTRLIEAAKGEGQAQEVPPQVKPASDATRASLIEHLNKPVVVNEPPQADEPAWIPHDGGPCPLRDEEVEEWQVKWKDDDVATYKNLSPSYAAGWDEGIIAYRVLKWKPGFGPEAKAEQSKDNHTLYQNVMDELRSKRTDLDWTRLQLNKSNDALRVFVSIWSQWPKVSAHQIQEACKNAKVIIGNDGLAEPATFEAHGKTWTRHTPGDRMPCEARSHVVVLTTEGESLPDIAVSFAWKVTNVDKRFFGVITGWRYADEPAQDQKEPAQPWTPAVGDTVRLKSGGDVYTVMRYMAEKDEWACVASPNSGVSYMCVPTACLTPAKP